MMKLPKSPIIILLALAATILILDQIIIPTIWGTNLYYALLGIWQRATGTLPGI